MKARPFLSTAVADRLAKLLGMLGSDHDGEVLNAARMADRVLRETGLTWADVIARPQVLAWREPETLSEAIATALQHPDFLTDWETVFLKSLRRRRRISLKQERLVEDIVAKVRAHVMAEAA